MSGRVKTPLEKAADEFKRAVARLEAANVEKDAARTACDKAERKLATVACDRDELPERYG